MLKDTEIQKVLWNSRAKMGYLQSGIDPKDKKGIKVAYIDLWSKFYLRRNLKLVRSDIICDLGCGSGRLSIYFSHYVQKVIGLDISDNMLREAKRLSSAKNVEYMQIDGLAFPLSANSVDKLFTCWLLQQVKNEKILRQIIRESYRVLKPNGKCCFVEQSAPVEFNVFQNGNFYKKIRMPEDYITLFEENGFRLLDFKIINEKGCGPYYKRGPYHSNRFPRLLSKLNPLGFWLDKHFTERKLAKGQFTDCLFSIQKLS